MSEFQKPPIYFHELLTIGTPVEVSDPKHQESEHRQGFVGSVEMASEEGVVVVDYEGTCFEVSPDEILLLEGYNAGADLLCVAKGTADHWYLLLVTTTGEIIPQAIVHDHLMALDILSAFNGKEVSSHP